MFSRIKYKYTTGAAIIKLSNLSSTPPCPGMIFPLSFTPNVLFSWLSTKSPSGAKIETNNPTTIQFPRKSGNFAR